MKERHVYIAIGLVLLALFSVFVWPTQWQYHGPQGLIRTNRITGENQVWYPSSGWETHSRQKWENRNAEALRKLR